MKAKLWGLIPLAAVCALLSLPAFATDAEPGHVWVHYDYMVFPPGWTSPVGVTYPNGVSTEPQRAAIDLVVDAFAKQGINLHIDPVHNAIPGHDVTIPDFYPGWSRSSTCAGSDPVGILELRKRYFQEHGNHPWHYAIFGWDIGVLGSLTSYQAAFCGPEDPVCGGSPDPTISGYSELPGFNFILGIGNLADQNGVSPDDFTAPGVGAIFMHELGHNFGLQHGGVFPPSQRDQSCFAWKANYISVMNYQNILNGIAYAATPGSTTPVEYHLWRVDYSSFTGLTLTEPDLDEFAGINGPPGDTDLMYYCAYNGSVVGCGYAAAFGPVDWNQDGMIEAHVAVGFCGELCSTARNRVWLGFDDWTYVKQQLQISPEDIDNMPKRGAH